MLALASGALLERARRSATTSPARSASASARRGCSSASSIVLLAARRPPPPGRSPSSASSCPHVARAITGPDYRWILPYCAVLAPILLLGADVVGRVVARPGELQVGIVTALVGAPLFIALVRRRKLAEL